MEFNINKGNNIKELYVNLTSELDNLLKPDEQLISKLANVSALLNLYLDDINWVGFYLYQGGKLVLGPFQGKPAVTEIEMGQGVCGTAAKERTTKVVSDVHSCSNHIACDLNSASEIVIPLINGDKLMGVLDIDSPIMGRFKIEDEEGLILFAEKLIRLT